MTAFSPQPPLSKTSSRLQVRKKNKRIPCEEHISNRNKNETNEKKIHLGKHQSSVMLPATNRFLRRPPCAFLFPREYSWRLSAICCGRHVQTHRHEQRIDSCIPRQPLSCHCFLSLLRYQWPAVCTPATQQLALASSWPLSFLLTMAHGIKNAASNIQYFSLFFIGNFLLSHQQQHETLCIVNAPAAATDAPWRKCAISYEIAVYSPLMGGLVLCSRAFWRSTLDNPEHHGPYRASSWPFSCFLFPCTVTSAPYATER